jgi:hypothetical protein
MMNGTPPGKNGLSLSHVTDKEFAKLCYLLDTCQWEYQEIEYLNKRLTVPVGILHWNWYIEYMQGRISKRMLHPEKLWIIHRK